LSRLNNTFTTLQKRNEKAFIPYITLGDPSPEFSLKLIRKLQENGADIIELGIPFSDPIADGPTIQASSTRALKAGMTTDLAFNLVKEIRNSLEIPLVFLTYYNIIFQRDVQRFFTDCSDVGIDGVIIPDLPIEEAEHALKAANANNVDIIFTIAPTTTTNRLNKILKYANGFLYLVGLLGTTGARMSLSNLTKTTLERIQPLTKDRIPVSVGFGISKPEHVKELNRAEADGIIVGSAIIDMLAKNLTDEDIALEKISEFTAKMKAMTLPNALT